MSWSTSNLHQARSPPLNLANSRFASTTRKPSGIDGRVVLPNITNKPNHQSRHGSSSITTKPKRKKRRSHELTGASFDRWLNTVLDPLQKDKLMSKFGSKFDPSDPMSAKQVSGASHRYTASTPLPLRCFSLTRRFPRRFAPRLCSQRTQSAPPLNTRSHKLFTSLSEACSFTHLPYTNSPLHPRAALLSTLFAKSLKPLPLSIPPTLMIYKGVVTFATDRVVKKYDVNQVPKKDVKKIIMALVNVAESGEVCTHIT